MPSDHSSSESATSRSKLAELVPLDSMACVGIRVAPVESAQEVVMLRKVRARIGPSSEGSKKQFSIAFIGD